ncbi:hypothetical protein ACL9RL_19560 [Plantibacter sp. Mn2098]|uniref:hypothetical protein n=1 Tax=Plantibacter sp. Mn2098 TaxID=3395266 RepID=UPI003BC9A7A5
MEIDVDAMTGVLQSVGVLMDSVPQGALPELWDGASSVIEQSGSDTAAWWATTGATLNDAFLDMSVNGRAALEAYVVSDEGVRAAAKARATISPFRL